MYALISNVIRGGVKVTRTAIDTAAELGVPERELIQVAARVSREGAANYRLSRGYAIARKDAVVRVVEREIECDSRLWIK